MSNLDDNYIMKQFELTLSLASNLTLIPLYPAVEVGGSRNYFHLHQPPLALNMLYCHSIVT